MSNYGNAWLTKPFAALYAPNGGTFLRFADFPLAAGNSGLMLGASDIGPAPGIQLVSNGSIWRPVNGSAVLAMRSANPVTVQNASGAVAETFGPFPGGLVRAGMRLQMDAKFDVSGVGTGNRTMVLRIGNGATRNNANSYNSTTTGANVDARLNAFIAAQSDTSASHQTGLTNAFGYGVVNATRLTPSVDFSQDWSADFFLTSANETAITITGATWAAGVATITATAHTLAVGDKTTIASVNPGGYNGVVIVTTVPDANTFTYALASDPGTYVSGGTSARISNMVFQSYVLTLFG